MLKQIENRRSVVFFLGQICGLVFFACPVAMAVGIGLGFLLRRRLPLIMILAVGFLVGLVTARQPVTRITEPRAIHGVGDVSSVPKLSREGQVCDVVMGGQRLLMVSGEAPLLSLGDEIRVSGIERPFAVLTTGYGPFMELEGVVKIEHPEVIRHGSWISRIGSQWRQSFVSFMGKQMPTEDAAFVDGVCFAAPSQISDERLEELKRSGLLHILSASGLQVFVLLFLLNALLRLAPIPRLFQIVLISAFLVVYALASGLNPAIVRASLMAAVLLAAYLFKRDPDPLSALALAGIGYLFWQPASVFGPGFQLSFVVVASVCLYYHRDVFEKGWNIVRLTKEYLRLSIVVTAAAVPLAAYYFGSISLVSILSNLLITSALPLTLFIAFFSHFVYLGLPALGAGIASASLSTPVSWIQNVAHWTGGDWATIDVPSFSGYWLLLWFGAWALTYRRRVVQA